MNPNGLLAIKSACGTSSDLARVYSHEWNFGHGVHQSQVRRICSSTLRRGRFLPHARRQSPASRAAIGNRSGRFFVRAARKFAAAWPRPEHLSTDAGFVASGCLRRRGGTGRRAGLKIQWPQGRVGSSPSAGSCLH